MKEMFNFELKNYNTFHVQSVAEHVFFIENVDELKTLNLQNATITGAASNILFSSFGVSKPLIFTHHLDKIKLEDDILNVQCGVKSPVLARFALENSISGFEFLTSIPSSVGGNIFMNAGAHNQEISDNLISVAAFDVEKNEVVEFDKINAKFGYRTSYFKENAGKYIILSAKFKVIKGNRDDIEAKMQKNIEARKNMQPSLKQGNAGSIFKNPENESAGRLLDLCNFKGVKEGGACVFDNHANFIVNENNATSTDILKLMFKMQNEVYNKFKIKLEPEVIFLGGKSEFEDELWIKIKE